MDFITYAAAVKAARKGVPYVDEGGLVEMPVTGQWFEETDADGNVTDSMYVVTAPIGLQIGSNYIVNWNGTDYEVTGQDLSVISGGEISGVILGNLSVFGGDDTGEPFVVLELSADIAAEMGVYGQIVSLDLSINIPFTIYGGNVTIQKIDPRCLPTGVPYVEESDDFSATLLPETEATLHDATEGVWRIEAVPPLKIGETYIINYNGTEYTCIAQDSSALSGGTGSVALGNLSNVGGFGNGEPFIFFTRPSSGVSDILNYRSSTPVTIAIYGKSVKVQKMDERCLPDNIGGVKLFTVNATLSSADKTFAQILSAISIGNTILQAFLDAGGQMMVLPLVGFTDEFVVFGTGFVSNSNATTFLTLQINADDSVQVFTG